MKITKRIFLLIMIMMVLMTVLINFPKDNVVASSNNNSKTPVRVAVFFDNSNAMYISLLKQELELIQKNNSEKVKFIFFDAKDNQVLQNESIDKALTQNYDLFIMGLVTPKLEEVNGILSKIIGRHMPLILNPDPNQEIVNFMKNYKRFVVIGADFKQSGTMEGELLANEWNSNKKYIDRNHDNVLQYVMLKGRIGSPLTDLRTKYSISALNNNGIKTEELESIYCEWIEDCAKSSVESLFLKYGNKIESIIANNDAMAVGAVKALQKYGYNTGNKEMTIPVVGIDGMPAAKELIQKGGMVGTVVVDPHDLAETLFLIGMNLADGKNPLENTEYKFDDTGFTVHLNYKEYKNKE